MQMPVAPTIKLPLLLIEKSQNPCWFKYVNIEVKTPDGSIECRFLPANTTSNSQPMSQGQLETMKCLYRKFLIPRLVSDNSTLIKSIKKVTLNNSIDIVARAWSVTDSHIQKAWIKSTLMQCFATEVPEATPDFPAINREDIQESFGHHH